MASWKYALSTAALDDLDSVDAYILTYADPEFADMVALKFAKAFDDLCEHPYAHPVYVFSPAVEPIHEYRSVNVYNYKVFYWLDEPSCTVRVYRILHSRADFTARSF